MRSFSLLVVSSVVLACGARTSLRDERGGPGGGGVGSTEPATSGSSAHASTSTGNDDCVSRTLDVGGQGAVVLQTDGEVAYFNTEDGRIVRGDLETGEELVLASGKEALGDMAIFDHHLYFSDLHAISRVPLGGGPEELVVDLASTSYAIAVDATGVYWVDGPGTLASHEVKRLTTTGEIVVLASNIQLPRGLSVGEHGVVFTDPYDWSAEAGTVRVVGIDGGPSTLLAESLPYPQFPFQRDGYVHWVEATDEMSTNHGGIVRVAIDGSEHQKVLSLEQQYPIWATTDGERWFMTVLDEASGSHLIAATYPVAGPQTNVATAGTNEFFTMVATTPKRVVWTVQVGVEGEAPVDGVRSQCRSAISFD